MPPPTRPRCAPLRKAIEVGWPQHSGTIGLAALIVLLDQLTKWWAVSTLDDRNIDLVWTLRFNLSYNTGAAFGSGQRWGISLISIARGCV